MHTCEEHKTCKGFPLLMFDNYIGFIWFLNINLENLADKTNDVITARIVLGGIFPHETAAIVDNVELINDANNGYTFKGKSISA